jgi:hypothetical protein
MTSGRAVAQSPGDHHATDSYSERNSPDFNHSRIGQA